MSVVEKNDVDINTIFVWGKEFQVTGPDDKVLFSVYIRLLGDADLNRARVYALRRSADLRQKLKTKGSDERIALIFDPDNLEDERLIYLIASLSMRELSQVALRDSKLPAIKVPKSDAPLEEMERYQAEVDAYDSKREELLNKNLNKEVSKLEKSLRKLTHEELIKRYEDAMINEVCEHEVLTAFRDYSAFAGTYKDAKYTKRYFKELDDFLNLPTDIKNQFVAMQQSLEISGEELKKLQPAMR